MTVKEAILALNANAVFACERAGFNSATVKMIEDALDTIEDALKAQEPRLMILDDLYYRIADGMLAYIETRHNVRPCILISHHAYPSWCCRTEIERHGVWIMDKHNMRRRWECKNYNKTWRCWTSRPDRETREATPWN